MVTLSHPVSVTHIWISVPGLAQESVQLIQNHLGLTADQFHLLFLVVNSSNSPLLGNPCCLTLAGSDLTFCLSQHGCESADCLGINLELCVRLLFPFALLKMIKLTTNLAGRNLCWQHSLCQVEDRCSGVLPADASPLYLHPRETQNSFYPRGV